MALHIHDVLFSGCYKLLLESIGNTRKNSTYIFLFVIQFYAIKISDRSVTSWAFNSLLIIIQESPHEFYKKVANGLGDIQSGNICHLFPYSQGIDVIYYRVSMLFINFHGLVCMFKICDLLCPSLAFLVFQV